MMIIFFNDSTNQHSLSGQLNKHEGTKEPPSSPGSLRWLPTQFSLCSFAAIPVRLDTAFF